MRSAKGESSGGVSQEQQRQMGKEMDWKQELITDMAKSQFEYQEMAKMESASTAELAKNQFDEET